MARRGKSMAGYLKGSLKRKATKSRSDLAYMMIWGEEPPKKHHIVSRPKRAGLW